jgi:hypothetical protein
MSPGANMPHPQRQSGLRLLQGLVWSLFIDAQNLCSSGLTEVQPDEVPELWRQYRIPRRLEVRRTWGLMSLRLQSVPKSPASRQSPDSAQPRRRAG